jgi:hypothetical protein
MNLNDDVPSRAILVKTAGEWTAEGIRKHPTDSAVPRISRSALKRESTIERANLRRAISVRVTELADQEGR